LFAPHFIDLEGLRRPAVPWHTSTFETYHT